MANREAKHILVRGGLVVADGMFPALIAGILVLGFAPPAYAYVDPSVMTYTIQALAGVAVALSAVLGVVWRRVRKHLLRILRIDENEGKHVEGAVHALDGDAPGYRDRLERADVEARRMKTELKSNRPEKLCWGTRFLFALAAALMLFYTLVREGIYPLSDIHEVHSHIFEVCFRMLIHQPHNLGSIHRGASAKRYDGVWLEGPHLVSTLLGAL